MIQLAEKIQKRKDWRAVWLKEKKMRELRLVAHNPVIDTLIFLAAKKYDLAISQLVSGGNRKYGHLVHAREVLVHILREKLLMSQPQIAAQMGYTAPSSVLLAERRVTDEQKIEADELWARVMEVCDGRQAVL